MKSLESFTCIKMSNSCESYLTFGMTTRIGVLVTLRHLAPLKMSLIKLQLLSATAISLSGQKLKRWILQKNVGHQEKRENRVKRENWTKKQRRNGYLVPWPGNFYERTRNWNKASSTNWTQCHWWRQARGRKEKRWFNIQFIRGHNTCERWETYVLFISLTGGIASGAQSVARFSTETWRGFYFCEENAEKPTDERCRNNLISCKRRPRQTLEDSGKI